MKKTYFTIAGTNHYYGQKYFEPNMEVRLVKEPDNEYDKEAIKVSYVSWWKKKKRWNEDVTKESVDEFLAENERIAQNIKRIAENYSMTDFVKVSEPE